MKIWKFKLGLVYDTQSVLLPASAQIIRVALQENQPTFWAIVDPDAHKKPRFFDIVGTGQEVPAFGVYLGSFEQSIYVWHAFEVTP